MKQHVLTSLALLAAGCSGDGTLSDGDQPPVRRGGLAVRLVVAPPSEVAAPDPCDAGPGDTGTDDDDDDDDDEEGLRAVHFSSIEVHVDELRLLVPEGDDVRSVLVAVERDFDLVGPATRDDEIVLDLELAEYRDAVVELVARDGTTPALEAIADACVVDDDGPVVVPVRVSVPQELVFASAPTRLVIGDGPDPRLSLGLQVDRWFDGLQPPSTIGTWEIGPESAGFEVLLGQIRTAIVTEVD